MTKTAKKGYQQVWDFNSIRPGYENEWFQLQQTESSLYESSDKDSDGKFTLHC